MAINLDLDGETIGVIAIIAIAAIAVWWIWLKLPSLSQVTAAAREDISDIEENPGTAAGAILTDPYPLY